MPATDLSLLIEAARAAGETARGFSGRAARQWEKPDGAGPVTEADLAVNDVLEEKLRGARPDYGWLSEESEDDLSRLACERVFVVDPIDGTRSFVEGSKTWAHSIAVVENGKVTAGVVYLPLRDKLYSAALGQGAFLNDDPLETPEFKDLGRANILAARPVMNSKNWRESAPPRFHRSYRPSLAYRMALVGEGRFQGMVTLRPCWEWDIAAGDLICREAGAVSSDMSGKGLKFNNRTAKVDGLIAATSDVHGEVLHRLSPRTEGRS
ncbi:MAG: 3'(2'),5'-bisphosphate nucleotidase CysQ [Arenibacterium sp.]